MKTAFSAPRIEALEARIAPATLIGKVLTYTDVDGDLVSITFSKGTFTAGMFSFDQGSVDGDNTLKQQLWLIDVSTVVDMNGSDLTLKVTRAPGGDGLAAIGRINAGNNDLGKVTIKGDLGQIDAGSGSASDAAIKALNVLSMGRYGLNTQDPGSTPDLISNITGNLGSLTVAGSVDGASLLVTTGSESFGNIGAITIRGSLLGADVLNSGTISAEGGIAKITIGQNLVGKDGDNSGRILAAERIGPVKIGGSLIGGSGAGSGQIFSDAGIASVTIGGSMIGGAGGSSARIEVNDAPTNEGLIGPVKIAGNLQGGDGDSSGQISSTGRISSITIGGSFLGGTNDNTGYVYARGDLGSLTINGSLSGGSGQASALIVSDGKIGPIKIQGDFLGGTGNWSAEIYTTAGGDIASFTVGGSMISGGALEPGIFADGNLGPVKIGGSVIGAPGGDMAMYIQAQGTVTPAIGAKVPLAIASVSIGGSVYYGNILAGWTASMSPSNGHVQIGVIKVAGDWIASTAAAGIQNLGVDNGAGGTDVNTDNLNWANSSDQIIAGGTASVVNRIASITVGGSVLGTADADDHFGFVATEIGSLKIAGTSVALTPNDFTQLAPLTGDVAVHLLPAP